MKEKCAGCGKKAGLQKTVEIGRLSQFVGVQVAKTEATQEINYATSLNLDKYSRGK